jgi:hypothetical protein
MHLQQRAIAEAIKEREIAQQVDVFWDMAKPLDDAIAQVAIVVLRVGDYQCALF